MMKFLKFIGWTILILVLLLIALVASSPLWLGPVAKSVLKSQVPTMTKTAFELESLNINPFTGELDLRDAVLGNPEGYEQQEPDAVRIGDLSIDLHMGSLTGSVTRIERLTVRDVSISYFKGGPNNVDNFSQIQSNVTGEPVSKESIFDFSGSAFNLSLDKLPSFDKLPSLDKMPSFDFGSAVPSFLGGKDRPDAPAAEEPRFIIDDLVIKNIRLKYGKLVFVIPSLECRDIGKGTNGVTAGEILLIVWHTIFESLVEMGVNVKDLAVDTVVGAIDVGVGAANRTIDSVKGAGESLMNFGSDVNSGLKDAGESLKGIFR